MTLPFFSYKIGKGALMSLEYNMIEEPIEHIPKNGILLAVFFKALIVLLLLPYISNNAHILYGLNQFADDYDKLAFSLANGYGYRFFPETANTIMREPGYPAVLAGVFWLFGYSLTATKLLNFFLALLGAFLVARLTSRVFGNKSYSIIAALLFLFHPGIIIAESRGGVEILFIVLFLLFVHSIYNCIYRGLYIDFVLAGFILGFAVLVKSTLMYFPLFLLFYLIIINFKRNLIKSIIKTGVLVISMLLILSPWIIRNYILVGKIIPTASVLGVAAYTGQYICKNFDFNVNMQELDQQASVRINAKANKAGYNYRDKENPGYYRYFYLPEDEVSFNSKLLSEVEQEYLAHPGLFLQCSAQNLIKFWIAGKTWISTLLNFVVQIPLIIGAIFAVIIAYRERRLKNVMPLVLFIFYYLTIHVVLHAQARYSIPILPLLFVLSAKTIDILWRKEPKSNLTYLQKL